MSSKSSSDSDKQDTNNDNSSFNPFMDSISLAQSSAIALINAYSEFLKGAPKVIEFWYNMFWNPWTTKENQRRDKVKVE